ncbi:MAG: GPP34 family phosphoprotein [Bacteroidota bacterium]
MQLDVLEKFILLAHHPEKKRYLISELYVNYGIIGAMLLDLSLLNKLDLRGENLVITDRNDIPNPMVAEVANDIHKSGKQKKVKFWVMKYGRKAAKYRHKILESLAEKNVIEIERKKFLGAFPYIKTRVIDRRIQESLARDVKSNVFNHRDISEEDTIMLGLVEACKMYKALSNDRKEIKKMKASLKNILKESPIADSIDKTVKQVQSAIMISIIASTTAATTATTATSN